MMFGQSPKSHRIFKRLAKDLIRLRVCAGWSESLLVAHTTLLKITCHGSYACFKSDFMHMQKVPKSHEMPNFISVLQVKSYTPVIMSDFQSNMDLQRYLDKLLEKSQPSTNDKRHSDYVRYINAFLSHFGDERTYLVGSTAEETKLTHSLDNGDADFLMVSGKLAIPVSEIECREDNASYVWIRGEHLDTGNKLGIKMTETRDGKRYLPANILHNLDARLFTIGRGIYKFVTTNTDSVPGQKRETSLSEKSSVGLARIELDGLKINDKNKIPQLRKYFPKNPKLVEPKVKKIVKDTEGINKILEVFALFGTSRDSREHKGIFERFTYVVKLLLDREKREMLQLRKENPIVQCIDILDDSTSDSGTLSDSHGDFEKAVSDLRLPTSVKATCRKKTMKDYVPALRVIGKLHFMQKWFEDRGNWLSDKVKFEIKNTELFVVAKEAAIDPNEKDFCLSFNHAEVILAKELTQTQRKCLLMLKAYHKGVFEKIMAKYNSRINLKTFHLKTALYWVLEETGRTELWEEENLELAVCQVLQYLREALLRKTLLHYFTKGNLFYGMETDLCLSLTCAIDIILDDPIKGLKDFFELENKTDFEITLTHEQVQCLIEMSQDGGAETQTNILEDVLDDFSRGFKEGPKNAHGNCPLQEAMDSVLSMYLQDEAEQKAKDELTKKSIPVPEDLGDIISGVLCSLLKSSTQQSSLTSENAKWRRLKTGDLLAGIANHFLQPSPQQNSNYSEMSDATQREETQNEETADEQSRSLNGARGQVLDKKDLLAHLVFNFFNSQQSKHNSQINDNSF